MFFPLSPRRSSQQEPGGVRQPLLGPAPVGVLPGLRLGQLEIDAIFVEKAAGDAVDDPAGQVLVLPGVEEEVLGVVPS